MKRIKGEHASSAQIKDQCYFVFRRLGSFESVRVVIIATVMSVLELSDRGSVDMFNFFFLDIVVVAVVWGIFFVIFVVRHCF